MVTYNTNSDRTDKKAIYGNPNEGEYGAMDFGVQLDFERDFAEAFYEARDERNFQRIHGR